MKAKLVVVFIGLTILTLTSCDPAKEFETELKVIDSCMTEIDKMDILYKGIEFDSLQFMVDHVNHNEKMMKDYFVADTIDMLLGSYMNNCKGIRKSLGHIQVNHDEFAKEITAQYNQFSNLKTDILGGVLDKEQINNYLTTEKNSLSEFTFAFMNFYNNQKSQSQIYYQCIPFVDDYVKKLNIPSGDTLQ